MKRLLVLITFLAAAACGSKSSTTPATGGTGPAEAAPGPLAPGAWEGMDHKARAEFMGKVVLPEMAAAFKAFDAEEFGEFDCKTCHGKGADDHSFEMPNPDLDALNAAMIMNPDDDHKAITEFMMKTVRPTMARLIGVPEWSPETPDGFGCFACHPQAQ